VVFTEESQKISGLVAGLCARGLQVCHAPNDGQPHSARDFDRDRQRVTSEHLHRHSAVLECGDELAGVRS
jgi:hypothetical protein